MDPARRRHFAEHRSRAVQSPARARETGAAGSRLCARSEVSSDRAPRSGEGRLAAGRECLESISSPESRSPDHAVRLVADLGPLPLPNSRQSVGSQKPLTATTALQLGYPRRYRITCWPRSSARCYQKSSLRHQVSCRTSPYATECVVPSLCAHVAARIRAKG